MSASFDPNQAAAADSGLFGLPTTVEEAALVVVPVPWEATTSYGRGTSWGPEVIREASRQIDLYDFHFGDFFKHGIALLPGGEEIKSWNQEAQRARALALAPGELCPGLRAEAFATVNRLSQQLNNWLYQQSQELLSAGKILGILGGEHSVPLGGIKALSERYPEMSILHIDAHADLRAAYGGFTYSHASIMYNVLRESSVKTLVQLGIRDFCGEELGLIREQHGRVVTFFDGEIAAQRYNGTSFAAQIARLLAPLSREVYISFDIDGLDPRYCPHTGTPVPGGFSFNEICFILEHLRGRGIKLLGFDLCEVSPGPTYQPAALAAPELTDAASQWDANVGARLLFKLCGLALCKPLV